MHPAFGPQAIALLLVLVPVTLLMGAGILASLTRTIHREVDGLRSDIRTSDQARKDAMIEEVNRLARISGARAAILESTLDDVAGAEGVHRT